VELDVPIMQQAGNLGSNGERHAVYQDDMATQAQFRRRLRQFRCLGEGGGVRHQRRRGDDAGLMRLKDGAVHAGGQTEVVRVNDQPSHPLIVANWPGRQAFRVKRTAG